MSSPIAIPSRSSRPSSIASPSSSPGVYVPVHRRTGSASSTSSSRSSSATRSEVAHPPAQQQHPFIYSRDALLNLAKSPLARIAPETREALRSNVPEIMTNRKQRKAIEYRNHVQDQAQKQVQKLIQDINVVRTTPLPMRRTCPVGRVPESRRRIATKVVDELSWRGRMPTIVSLAPITV